jgi:serine/threonine protein kinase
MSSSGWGNRTRYGDFEVVGARDKKPRLIGEGSFGKTFEAVREDIVAGSVIKDYVALKVLNPSLLATDSKRLQFVQELVALTKFKHSNLIHYIRCGEEGGEVFYAMELCRGGDLTKLVKRYGPLPEKVAALIGLQVAAGLREVHHRHRLVHRDIKPSNIMLVDEMDETLGVHHLAARFEEQDSLCRIVDFGLVDFALNAQEEGAMPLRQRFAGSPMYASPEQVREQPVDGRCDIYSLGMTLWYLVQGKGPLLDAKGNDLRDQKEAMRRHTDPSSEHDKDFPRHLSESFRKLLSKMVAKRPEERFANASELQAALRQYLVEAAQKVPKAYSINKTGNLLEDVYTLGVEFPSRMGRKCFRATHRLSGSAVKLTLVEDLEEGRLQPDEVEAIKRHLSGLAEIASMEDFPPMIMRVTEVIHATDMLAYAEELPPGVPLAEVLRQRARLRRPVSFAEAVNLLRPVAEALDYLIQHGSTRVYLPCEELWVSSMQIKQAAPGDEKALCLPFQEWEMPEPRFSMMWLSAAGRADNSATMSSLNFTVSGSMQSSDSASHPLLAFCRLAYRMLTGSEIAAAAEFVPTAYVQTASLGPASNNLIRDLVSQMTDRPNVNAVLAELCINEGVIQPRGTGQTGSARAPTREKTFTQQPDSRQSSVVGSSVGGSGISDSTSAPDTIVTSGKEICKVVRPGVVISPYDKERREIEVKPREWVPGSKLRCPATARYFHLPKKLDSLVARVVSPGVVQSPYADHTMKVPWESWVPGMELRCTETGKDIALPQDLPLPTGTVPPMTVGKIISPYVTGGQFSVPASSWNPGAEVTCPVTGLEFLMPAELPPLEALADLEKPGLLASPYAPTVSWPVSPEDWTSGRRIVCPGTRREIVLPAVVDRWVPETRVTNAERRMVQNPFAPGEMVQVPAYSWQPGNLVTPGGLARAIKLPADLPPLVAEIISGRDDAVRSPYTSEVVPVSLADWIAGHRIKCPRTGMEMLLPESLPERIPLGTLPKGKRGYAISPYFPDSDFEVPRDQWAGGSVLTCPVTGRKFSLPPSVPCLLGIVKKGSPGLVASPFAPDREIKVPLDEWVPEARRECPVTRRPFDLPADIEEWIVDGEWVPKQPGQIRSPLGLRPVVAVTPDQWKAGGLLTAPGSSRRFRIPEDAVLPSLALEKEAVAQALADPESSDAVAAKALATKYPEATTKLIGAIRARHRLATLEDRQRAQETGEVIPNEPGYVRSPYGAKPRVEVPPAKWVEPGGAMHCPETGRRFLLPTNLPHLIAMLVSGKPGSIVSPFAEDKPYEVEPQDWEPDHVVKCKHSGHALRLPATLPPWRPFAKVADGNEGHVFSPFSPKMEITVPGVDWKPGQILKCHASGKEFVLPEILPPLIAKNVKAGSVESPYAPGSFFEVAADQWKPGSPIRCPQTQRLFRLPQELPEKEWPATVERPGIVRSPYGSRPEVEIPGTQWAAGISCKCPETGRSFTLPEGLPPMEVIVREGITGSVFSPYMAHDCTVMPVDVSIRDWEPGYRVLCPVTKRLCVLPEKLPLWEGDGIVPTGQPPGTIESPYRVNVRLTVPAKQWNPGERLQCPESKRFFHLPKELPLLEGRVADAAHGQVISPYDESAKPQTVPEQGWLPENVVTCEVTGKTFRLPKDLGNLALEATVLPNKPGFIRSPYGRKREVPVPGPAWLAGARVSCPETGKTFVMPVGLAPLTAALVEGKPGRVLSPYTAKAKEISIPHRKWLPGEKILCRASRREFILPKKLPEWVKPPMHWSLKAAAAIALLGILSLGGYYGYDRLVVNEGGGSEEISGGQNVSDMPPLMSFNDAIARIAELKTSLADRFEIPSAKEYVSLIARVIPQITDQEQQKQLGQDYTDTKIRLVDEQSGDAALAGKATEITRNYFAAKALGESKRTEQDQQLNAMRASKQPYDLLVLAMESYEQSKLPGSYPDLQMAAERNIGWASRKLLDENIAKPGTEGKLTASIEIGNGKTETINVPRVAWKPGPVTLMGKDGKTPWRWLRLPDDLPKPPPVPVVLKGGVQFEGLGKKRPEDFAATADGKPATFSQQGGVAMITLPDDVPQESKIILSAPGWDTYTLSIDSKNTAEGSLVVQQPVLIARQRHPLPLKLPESKQVDYDFLDVEWSGPLQSQPGAVFVMPAGLKAHPSRPNTARLAITGEDASIAVPMPSGIYKLTLAGADPSKVLDFPAGNVEASENAGKATPRALPQTLAGIYFGLFKHNFSEDSSLGENVATTREETVLTMLSIKFDPGIKSFEVICNEDFLPEFEANVSKDLRGITATHLMDIRYAVWGSSQFTLLSPGTLSFTGFYLGVPYEFVLDRAEQEARLYFRVAEEAAAPSKTALHSRMLAAVEKHHDALEAKYKNPQARKKLPLDVDVDRMLSGWSRYLNFLRSEQNYPALVENAMTRHKELLASQEPRKANMKPKYQQGGYGYCTLYLEGTPLELQFEDGNFDLGIPAKKR